MMNLDKWWKVLLVGIFMPWKLVQANNNFRATEERISEIEKDAQDKLLMLAYDNSAKGIVSPSYQRKVLEIPVFGVESCVTDRMGYSCNPPLKVEERRHKINQMYTSFTSRFTPIDHIRSQAALSIANILVEEGYLGVYQSGDFPEGNKISFYINAF